MSEAAQNPGAPARKIKPVQLWSLLTYFAGAAALITITTFMVVWLYERTFLTSFSGEYLSAADKELLEVKAVHCGFKGVDGQFAVLSCPDGERHASVRGAVPIIGLTRELAQTGFERGLADYARLTTGQTMKCDLWVLSFGPVAECYGNTLPDLSEYLVATGLASAIVTDLKAVQEEASRLGVGLNADLAAMRRTEMQSVGGWFATAFGLVGTMAAFLYNVQVTSREWQFEKQRTEEELSERVAACDRACSAWYRQDDEANSFEEALQNLVGFLRQEHRVGEWGKKPIKKVDEILRRVKSIDDNSPSEHRTTIRDLWGDLEVSLTKYSRAQR